MTVIRRYRCDLCDGEYDADEIFAIITAYNSSGYKMVPPSQLSSPHICDTCIGYLRSMLNVTKRKDDKNS